MFTVALCGLPNSMGKIDERIACLLRGTATRYSISVYDSIDELLKAEKCYNLYFLNRHFREYGEAKLLSHIEKNGKRLKEQHAFGQKSFNFLTYADDPVSESDCNEVLECVRRYLDYDAMYLCVEFLTNQGLRSIAISKILYFEYVDRKIIVKTQHSQYTCDDTLKHIISLLGGYAFASPHKSFIVNMRHILEIKGYTITMNDKSIIPLSQKKSREFRRIYRVYLEAKNVRIEKRIKQKP